MPENQNPHDAESLLNELEITVDPLNTGTFKSKQLKDHALLQTFHLIQDFWERFRRLPLENATLESEHRTWSKWQSFQEGWEQADESVRETILKEDYYGLLRSFIEKAQSRAMKAKIDQTVIKFFADPLAKTNLNKDNGLIYKTPEQPENSNQKEFSLEVQEPTEAFDELQELLAFQTQLKEQGAHVVPLKQTYKDTLPPKGTYLFINRVLARITSVFWKEDKTKEKQKYATLLFANATRLTRPEELLLKLLNSTASVVTLASPCNAETIENHPDFTGYVYVVKSKSKVLEIQEQGALYKIGFTTKNPKKRIATSKRQSTYLYDGVDLVYSFACMKVSAREFEKLLHSIFALARVTVSMPHCYLKEKKAREWYRVPFAIIEEAVQLVHENKHASLIYCPERQKLISRREIDGLEDYIR